MPSSDYSNAVGGGLKLKGTGAGIDKKKKKKKPKPENSQATASKPNESEDTSLTQIQKALAEEDQTTSTEPLEYGKTEAERRHEERRKKRLEERLKREGAVLTHKERVEQLNKYLSTLSEHNDMPRIGPG
ncbi:hypothetical protein HII31_13633 [Pseudocercospora fuligena]|uniref:DUF1754-domain-containing protein n=1 Tax=Pseudocercospora fuligena TaxID=685502 RepID=A0A8H6R4C3_9PEZI|nr:hypothetical protein HII31_13633 [Pseudocercospora fuligena]